MAMTRHHFFHDGYIMNTMEDLVPQDHLVRRLENALDWSFIYPLVENLYSPIGRPSIDPVVLFKLIVINKVFGIHSMRRTCKEAQVNIAYRWYLQIGFDDKIPNYSTWSQNYIRRYEDSQIFEEIFHHILMQLYEKGFLDLDVVFGDSTHRKADANKNKSTDKEVEIEEKAYDEELLKEINEQRKKDGKKEYDSIVKKEMEFEK
jgi:transposase